MKKLLSFILMTFFIINLLSGCQNGKKDNSNVKTSGKEPITFKMFIAETNTNNDGFKSPVAKEIQKKTGVTLKIENALNAEGGTQQISMMAASGDYPDFVYAKGDIQLIKNAGGLVKLDEYIEKDGKNIQKFYGDQIKRLRWSTKDPSIYYFGGAQFGQENMEPNTGFQLQHAVIKELGYPKMETLADYENALKTYKEKHPKIDGQETIGMSLLADDWRFLISVSNPACFATGASDDGEWYVDPDTLKLQRHILRPEEKEYFRWLNHMNDIGLLDPDSFVQKYDQYMAKIASGRVLGLSDARWEILEPMKALKNNGKEDRCYGFYPLTLDSGTKYAEFTDAGYSGWGIGITTSCKDIERAVKFFDWMCTEEAQILTQWGVEGTHYDIVEGKRQWKDEITQMNQKDTQFQKKTGIGNYTYPFPSLGNTFKDSTGQYFTPVFTLDAIIKNQTPIENEILAKYNVKAWKELYPQKDQFKVKAYGAMYLINIDDTDIKATNEKILQIGYKMIPAAIQAKPEDFDKKFDAYIKAIKDAGLDKVTKAYQEALNDRLELWK